MFNNINIVLNTSSPKNLDICSNDTSVINIGISVFRHCISVKPSTRKMRVALISFADRCQSIGRKFIRKSCRNSNPNNI